MSVTLAGSGIVRHSSKAYAVQRATLQGHTIIRYNADGTVTRLYNRKSTYIRERPGRFFYCQHCGKRVTASDAVAILGDGSYISCGNHGETVVQYPTIGDFYR